ncbi:hypothetical protein SLS64_007904 [Diaporthe eres]|uniref:F-box domain-containing protein n=1 Tax=Diaporthe eres TaxID=83184 RepID=A0ABR1PFA4_DIAER
MDSNDLQRQGSDSEAGEGLGSPAKCIESLPVEIQRQIMFCLPSLASLGAIIRASPIFYSLFQSEPKNFIANCLILGLGDAFLDASTAQAAMQDDFQRQRRDAMKMRRESTIVWPFLESYLKRVQELPCNAWIHSISLPEAVQMATFHTSTVEPLVEQYASWALGNIGTSAKPTTLSSTERMRIQRAMCYFRNFLVSQGLPLLASVLPIDDHDELVDGLSVQMHHFKSDTWLDDITGNTDSSIRLQVL